MCSNINCSRKNALLWSSAIKNDEEDVGTFEIFEGLEPADAAYEFAKEHNLTLDYRTKMLNEACNVLNCQRKEPGTK